MLIAKIFIVYTIRAHLRFFKFVLYKFSHYYYNKQKCQQIMFWSFLLCSQPHKNTISRTGCLVINGIIDYFTSMPDISQLPAKSHKIKAGFSSIICKLLLNFCMARVEYNNTQMKDVLHLVIPDPTKTPWPSSFITLQSEPNKS